MRGASCICCSAALYLRLSNITPWRHPRTPNGTCTASAARRKCRAGEVTGVSIGFQVICFVLVFPTKPLQPVIYPTLKRILRFVRLSFANRYWMKAMLGLASAVAVVMGRSYNHYKTHTGSDAGSTSADANPSAGSALPECGS